ncbi:MAG: MgtC/SapB family protein [Anaerolineaceae bacterium]|nr:MgtC/SapB family protein [Anaerolineaceae bacterium]
MFSISDFEPWWRFGFSLLIGALIGLEREFYQQKEDSPDFAGIRTFSLIALLGAVTAYLIADFGIILMALALGGLILMSTVSYFSAINRKQHETGITTEVAALLTFLFGVLVMSDHALVAISLAVVTALLLAFKGPLHGFIRNMNSEDIHVTLKFALVAAVILPLLPNRTIDPWGLFNPFQIWLMVVLVSGIGFSGYVMMKLLGASRGINLTGIFGGLASSTATTISFSSASREYPEMSKYYANAVVLASTVMFPRIFILILIIHPPLAMKVLIPLLLMLLTGLITIFFVQRNDRKKEEAVHPEFTITNPLKLSTAIKFGLFFAVILIMVEYAQRYLGTSGVYLTSLVAGLTDVDAISLSLSRLANRSQIALDVAGSAVIIAALVNTITKGVIAYVSGTKELRRPVIKAFSFMLLVGIVSGVIVFYL